MSKGTDRLLEKKWGVFNHYLYNHFKPDDWNECVDSLDVKKLAKNLHDVGAGYYFITIMQRDKYLLSPNATYDKIAGTKPGEACARRDVILEIADELAKYDIDLYLYFTGGGPWQDPEVGHRFWGDMLDQKDKKVTKDFVEKWTSVLEDYAVRYGDKVKGWWVDGCYKDVLGYTDELLAYYLRAAKKGNPDSIVALNGGSRPDYHKNYIGEDYVCGEFIDFVEIPESRYVDGAQTHRLAPLGGDPYGNMWPTWNKRGLKHTKEYMLDYVRAANNAGTPVTIDIFVDETGNFDEEQMEVLRYISKNLLER